MTRNTRKQFFLRRGLAALSLAAQLLVSGAANSARAEERAEHVNVKLLAINDFHGQLSSKPVNGRLAGGAAVLASYLKNAQLGVEDRTILVSVGDLVGASAANSALLQDEPSVMFLNTLANSHCGRGDDGRFDPRCNVVATVGNHEFDEGVAELKRLLHGGNFSGGPFLEAPYSGAHFPYVAANVVVSRTGKTLLRPYVIKTIRNIPIAFIGAVLKDTPSLVAPARVAGLTFLEETKSINRCVAELRRKGVKAIVVVIHQGGAKVEAVVRGLDSEIDVVLSGHSHGLSNQRVKNARGKEILVTQALSSGSAFATVDLELDPTTHDVVASSATVTPAWVSMADGTPAVAPDPTVSDLVARADALVAPRVQRVVGQTAATITRVQNPAGESALGNLIADAQRARQNTDFAFMNSGGIRADLDKGDVTWGKLFAVQPFGNQLVRMTLTGRQIYALLAQQWSDPVAPKMLQVSGLTYRWRYEGQAKPGTILEVRKNGALIDAGASYTVTTNSFLSGEGDGFTVFKAGRNQLVDTDDIDAVVSYVEGLPKPFDALIDDRIRRTEHGPAQFVYTSDPQYGITRAALDGSGTMTDSHTVHRALVTALNELPQVAFPCGDGGIKACEPVGTVDFVALTGNIANRMEAGVHSSAVSWAQFYDDYLGTQGIRLQGRFGTSSLFLSPGAHDVSNAVGFYNTMSPPFDATCYVNSFNRMRKPTVPLTNDRFLGTSADDAATAATAAASYAANKVFYSKDVGGVHFVFVGLWPDAAARSWLDTDLRKVSPTTPVVLFSHDQPDLETKHLMNPNAPYTVNAEDKFENLVLGENNGLSSVLSIAEPSTAEQKALGLWLSRHKNVVAYFHGNSNWNQFYTYTDPAGAVVLNTFRVDSPMRGEASGKDPAKLSFQVVSIDEGATAMTVREYRWHTRTWGASTTVPLTPRPR